MVPAVVATSVSVVSMTSMSVAVPMWVSSYRVGVVMVVCRLFSMSSAWNGWVGFSFSRSMLMSPCIVNGSARVLCDDLCDRCL